MKLLFTLLLFFSAQAYSDSCSKESNYFIELVGVKWGVNSNIEKNPGQYEDEKWQYIHSLGKDIFKKAKINEEVEIVISKLLANNNFSKNPEVEVNIFEDYWLLSCREMKKGFKSTPLSDIPKDSLLECWNKASSRKEFQICLTPLVRQK